MMIEATEGGNILDEREGRMVGFGSLPDKRNDGKANVFEDPTNMDALKLVLMQMLIAS